MSADKLIQRINDDASKQAKQILDEAKQQATNILNQQQTETKQEAKRLDHQGHKNAENAKCILISQAEQQARRELMATREHLIEQCFDQAKEQLQKLTGKSYTLFMNKVLTQGKEQLGSDALVWVTRDEDKQLVKDTGLSLQGTIAGMGGCKLQSKDGRITIDQTFNGIIQRKQQDIRIQVGKLLFSNQGEQK